MPITPLTTQNEMNDLKISKEELIKAYHRIRGNGDQVLQPYAIINPERGGSDELLKAFLDAFGTWPNAIQACAGKPFSWNGEFENVAVMLLWIARQLEHSPTATERDHYRRLGIIPADKVILSKFGRKDMDPVYRRIRLPFEGAVYSPKRST